MLKIPIPFGLTEGGPDFFSDTRSWGSQVVRRLSNRGTWLVPILLLSLAGCSLHTPVSPSPKTPMPERFDRTLRSADLGLDRPWWTFYGDPQLDRLMRQTLADNLELEQAWARLRQADAGLRVAGAGLWPTLTGEGQADRQRLMSDTISKTETLSVVAHWELDLWGKLRARTDAARYRHGASREDLRGLYLSLSARLADAYFLWQEQQAQLALAQATSESIADTLQRVERRYRGGLVGALDVYQSRQTLAAARAAVANRQQTVVEARSGLAVLLGAFQVDDHLQIRDLPLQAVPWAEGLSADLLLQRPDIRAAALRLRALDRELEAAIADRLPTLSLGGLLETSRSETGGVSLSGLVWRLFANLSGPLVDGGRRRAEVDRSRATVDEALAGYRQSLLTAVKEVEDALAGVQNSRQRVDRLQAEVVAADAALRLATDNYFQGLTDYLDVLSAQRLQFDARSRLLLARRDHVVAQTGLATALGGGWMNRTIERGRQTAGGWGE